MCQILNNIIDRLIIDHPHSNYIYDEPGFKNDIQRAVIASQTLTCFTDEEIEDMLYFEAERKVRELEITR